MVNSSKNLTCCETKKRKLKKKKDEWRKVKAADCMDKTEQACLFFNAVLIVFLIESPSRSGTLQDEEDETPFRAVLSDTRPDQRQLRVTASIRAVLCR